MKAIYLDDDQLRHLQTTLANDIARIDDNLPAVDADYVADWERERELDQSILDLTNAPEDEYAGEWQPGDTPTCNEHLVRNLMNFNPTGALCQAFIIEAIRKFARNTAKADPAQFDTPMLSGRAWVECAKHIDAECEKFYNRHNTQPGELA